MQRHCRHQTFYGSNLSDGIGREPLLCSTCIKVTWIYLAVGKRLIDSFNDDVDNIFSEQKLTQGSRLSLISSGISYGNVSLSEYGDTEAGKYDEDGSFIGNYGVEYK